MGQFVKENAHLKTDMNKYGENYDRIFNKEPTLKIEKDENEISQKFIFLTPRQYNEIYAKSTGIMIMEKFTF